MRKMGHECAGFWNLFAAKRHLFLTFCRCFRLAWRMLSPFNGGPNESIHSSLRIPSGYWIWRRNYSQLMWMADGNIVGYCWNAWHVWQRMAHVLPPFSLQQSPVREKARAKAAKVPPGCLTFCIGIWSCYIVRVRPSFVSQTSIDAIPHSTNFGLKSK